MRTIILLAAVIAAVSGIPAFAEEASPQPSVRVDTDEAHKAFVFIIDGEPVALLDKSGLHVRGDIDYGATLTDAGAVSFDKRIAETKKEAAHD